jgi:hypothetical protein
MPQQPSAFSSHRNLAAACPHGLHTAEADLRDGDYFGGAINRTARLMSIGHGGQVLLSETSAQVVREHLPVDWSLLDLGVHYLKGLARPEKISQLGLPDLPNVFPPLNSIPTATNNLPTQLTSFIGREKEITEIEALLDSSRLVTITGSGGTGKTRLSIEVGERVLLKYNSGVWMVQLASLSDPAQIIPALAQVFGLQESPFSPLSALITDYLRAKTLLLILDNCEHLIAACAPGRRHAAMCGAQDPRQQPRSPGIAGEMAYRTLRWQISDRGVFCGSSRAALKFSPQTSILINRSNLHPSRWYSLAIELAAAPRRSSPDQCNARMIAQIIDWRSRSLTRQQTLRHDRLELRAALR